MAHYSGYAEEVVTLATYVYLIPDSIGYTAAAVIPSFLARPILGFAIN